MAKNKKSKKKSSAAPTPADADVVVKLYDLRRESLMRASRDTLLRWQPTSLEDITAMGDFEHQHNAAFRQVTSYFEMAFGLARCGAVHAELIAEWCGEGIYLYSKVQPFLQELREALSPTAFANAEWITKNTKWGKGRLALYLARATSK